MSIVCKTGDTTTKAVVVASSSSHGSPKAPFKQGSRQHLVFKVTVVSRAAKTSTCTAQLASRPP